MENIFFFYLETKIIATTKIMTGAEIKSAIKAVVPTLDLTHDLVLEGHGRDEDKLIRDDDKVDLSHGHGEGPKHFFTRPPTNFGRG
jgi:hypothetical protein